MKAFIWVLALFCGLMCSPLASQAAEKGPELQHIRNATEKLTVGNTTFLIDPMFAEVGAYEGFPDTYRSFLRNPLTPLPMPVEEILDGVDAIIITHTHLDHWDPAAQKALPKTLPVYVQNEQDAKLLNSQGFKDVRIMKNEDEFGGVKLARTATRHGTEAMYADPEIGKALGEVMGIVFTGKDGKKVWLIGDSVWFKGIDEALEKHKPDVIIVNAGGAALTGAKFREDPEIIMDKDDVLKLVKTAPNSDVVTVHMDAINHMTVDRKDLSEFAYKNGIRDKVKIPFDGEKVVF